ncbi:hypothetical protein BY458DRAFT_510643 [Sporodiniella umbellata]|nr:hypothetical protein BY458DRAFT_510643 [Sporodiniella umbellata]
MSIYNTSKFDRNRIRTGNPRPRMANGRPVPRGQVPMPSTQTFPAPSFDEFQLLSSEKQGQHHLMDFKTNKKVDFKTFTPPVKLHRKEPDRIPYRQYIQQLQQQNNKAQQANAGSSAEVQPPTSHGPKTGADTSLIAPMGGATRNKQMLFKKRTKQIYLAKEDTRELKEQEHRPWILEDIEGQNNFTGTLEGGQRSDYMLFVLAENGFKVVPVDRWYKFQPKRNFKTLSIEEAEEQLKRQQKHESQRWMMLERHRSNSEVAEDTGPRHKFKVVDNGEKSGNKEEGETTKQDSDIDDLDFDDDFQDDEEGVGDHEAEDEDVKDSKERVKKEFKDFKLNGGDDYDLEDLENEIKLSTEGKQMRKLVRDLEKNQDYDSDDDKDPYASSDDEAASDEEEKKSDEESKDKSTPILPKKKQAGTPSSSSSKLFMPKKGLNKPKKDAVSKPIGRPESPMMNKKKEGSPNPMSSSVYNKSTAPRQNSHSPPHRSTSPIAVDQNRKRKSEDVSSDRNKQRKPSAAVIDDDIITEQEVIDTLKGRKMVTKEFLMCFRKRIKKNPRNREIVSDLLKKVARHCASDDPKINMLELKPEFQRAN